MCTTPTRSPYATSSPGPTTTTLREQVKRDALTGLLNHRACHEWLRDALAAALPAGNPVGVVTLDIDHFKLINDAHGHAEGDRILASVAERLRSVVRASDGDRTGRSRVPGDDRQRDEANSYEHEPRHRITVPAEPGDRADVRRNRSSRT